MNKTEAQIVSYGILYLNPSSYQCQPSYKKYIAALTSPYQTQKAYTGGGHFGLFIASNRAACATISH